VDQLEKQLELEISRKNHTEKKLADQLADQQYQINWLKAKVLELAQQLKTVSPLPPLPQLTSEPPDSTSESD